ncbi:MAG: phosphatase PAP2 family protein, partial [Lachnospiraceae bacterium]
ARQGKEYCMRFAMADMMSRVICGFFFILIPTTNVRPELLGNGIWEQMLQGLYKADAATNLFPSIHCLVSWFCFIGIRGRKEVPKYYRVFSCIFAVLICVSTQMIKQHYIVDVIGAIVIAEGTFYIGFHTKWYLLPEKIFDKITAAFCKGYVCDEKRE